MLICNRLIIAILKWLKYLHFFLGLISNTVNNDNHDPHKQKLLEVLCNFSECQGVLWPKNLRTTALIFWGDMESGKFTNF